MFFLMSLERDLAQKLQQTVKVVRLGPFWRSRGAKIGARGLAGAMMGSGDALSITSAMLLRFM